VIWNLAMSSSGPWVCGGKRIRRWHHRGASGEVRRASRSRLVGGGEPALSRREGSELAEAHGAGDEACGDDAHETGEVIGSVWESASRSHRGMQRAARRTREPALRMSILRLRTNAGARCPRHRPLAPSGLALSACGRGRWDRSPRTAGARRWWEPCPRARRCRQAGYRIVQSWRRSDSGRQSLSSR
jgi:hypothetical protein